MKKFSFLVFALTVLGLTTCRNDENSPGKKASEGNPLPVSVTIKGGSGSIISRADGTPIPGTTPENAIMQIEFFVYDENGDLDTAYPYFSPVTTTGTHTFLVTEGDNKKFLVAINQGLGAAAAEPLYDDMMELLANKLLFTSSQNDSQTAIPDATGYAMAGEGTQTVREGNTNKLEITVSRLLSRVRAPKVKGSAGNLELQGSDLFPTATVPQKDLEEYLFTIFGQDYTNLGGTPVENLKWEFTGYVLINGIDRSYAFSNALDDNWAPTGKNYFKTTYAPLTNGKDLESVYGGASGGDFFLPPNHAGEIFVYENNPAKLAGTGTGSTPAIFVEDEVTAFLIKGDFSATNINSGAPVTRYWRINLIKDDIWKIYRNCVYEITMNTIHTPGFGTPKEAEEDGPIIHPDDSTISIDLMIAPWGFKTQGVDL